MRKCGFDTRLMANRSEIVDFCKEEENSDFVVLSTGKGHKQVGFGFLNEFKLIVTPPF